MPEVAISAAAMRIVRLLVGNPPQTIAELIRATGVTRTAVSEQLNELVAGGFVTRTMERLPGRGRPRYLYAATNASLALMSCCSHQSVVPAIWRAIDHVGGRELTKKVLKRVAQSIVETYRSRVTGRTTRERFRQLTDLLREEGNLVEVCDSDKSHLVLRKRSCAFVNLFEESRTICNVDLDVMSALVQAPVRRVECRHDGDPCCAFELCTANGK
jgi:DeoR family transcriptional regulator, suf operon transcriptional repressor